jgi:hypothetical protein
VRIARREWRWVAAWTSLALLFANAPLLLGWALSTPDMGFGGAFYNVQDVHSYLANMRQGWRGEWLYHNPYTPEEHPGSLIYMHYLLLGKVAARSGLSLEATYHLARVACGTLLLLAVYHFLAQFTPHLAVRRVAFVLVAFSGGLGWLLIAVGQGGLLGSLPLDLISPEGYAFLTLYSPPHIALAMAGVLWGVAMVYRTSSGGTLAGGAAFAGVAVIGAFYLIVPFAVLCAYALVQRARSERDRWRLWAAIGLALLAPALPAAYTVVTFVLHPVYRAWAAQNQVRSPHPLHYLAGYALPGALALLGVAHAVRRRHVRRMELPIVWVALVPLLLYVPLNVQRRLILGAQVPLCLLAAQGLVAAVALPFGRSRPVRWLCSLRLPHEGWARRRSRLVRRLLRPWLAPRYSPGGLRRLLIAAAILATVPTNLLLVAETARQLLLRAPPIYHPRDELDALDWLAANTSPQDTVLCAYETGNYVPARAGNRVVLGLGPQTVDVERKLGEVQRFFGSGEGGEVWRRELLQRYGVSYVLVGPRERALGRGPGLDDRAGGMEGAPYLVKVYEKGTYAVYRPAARAH